MAGSVEAGDDALQDGFAKALVSLHQFRGEGSLEAWIWRIRLNEARDTRRKPASLPIDDAAQIAAPSLDDELARNALAWPAEKRAFDVDLPAVPGRAVAPCERVIAPEGAGWLVDVSGFWVGACGDGCAPVPAPHPDETSAVIAQTVVTGWTRLTTCEPTRP